MKQKILFIGDSSSLSRKEVPYESIYPTLLKRKLSKKYMIETYGKPRNTSKEIYTNLEAFMLYGYNPDIVVLNYGIVDVYPRPYPRKIYKILQCLGLLSYLDKILKGLGIYYKMSDMTNFKEVNKVEFQFYSEGIIKKLLDKKVKKVIIIGVIKPYRSLLKSKKADSEIRCYNDIFYNCMKKYKEVRYIDIYADSKEDFTIWDGYHYSEKASMYLANKIEKALDD